MKIPARQLADFAVPTAGWGYTRGRYIPQNDEIHQQRMDGDLARRLQSAATPKAESKPGCMRNESGGVSPPQPLQKRRCFVTEKILYPERFTRRPQEDVAYWTS